MPSGTSRTVLTDAEGRYTAQGLRVGGPFDVKASGDGGANAEQDDVFLQLAEETTLNLNLSAPTGATELAGVTVRTLPLALEERWFKPGLLSEVLETEGLTPEKIAVKIYSSSNLLYAE